MFERYRRAMEAFSDSLHFANLFPILNKENNIKWLSSNMWPIS